MTPVSALSPLTTTPAPAADKAKLVAAAKQFEAIFVRQMLAAAHKASFGDSLLGSEAQDTFRQMQDSHFADLASERGVFGLAASIERQLAAQASPLPPAGGAGGGQQQLRLDTDPPLTPPASGRGTLASSPQTKGL